MLKKLLMILVPFLALIAGSLGGDLLQSKSAGGAGSSHETAEADTGHGEAADAEHGTPDKPDPAGAKDDGHGGGHDAGAKDSASHGETNPDEPAWFAFPRQFFVPLMRNGDMGAIMILTLSLETDAGSVPDLETQEHRLRDALLRQLMIAANTGGFDGNFTSEARLRPLREGLLEAVKAATDADVSAVLIEDIARQAG